jgi:Flp pilus assembly protein TadB
MDRHWKAIQFGSIVCLAAFILAIVNGWYLASYALIVACILGAFLFSVHVARLDKKPSYEDEEATEKNR